ncbi:MAG: hypothetical protein LBQ64_02035 [Bacteroidales bacterium]|jgi:hypothetical protein|nr:hypothetical protein [Bacteroidales bacterium]
MIIANPIYDVVFKRLMENERVAKFFIGTLLDETIESVKLSPQEFTRTDEKKPLSLFRLDFIATIKTKEGELKKILIEIQKTRKKIDLMRFRNYLGEQYKKEDNVDNQLMVLPITSIYILGFNLPEIESACIKVAREYKDLINKTTLKTKSEFIEQLTHDSYIVQVGRITDRYQTRLDKLLSIFEQANFVDNTAITKQYKHPTDDEEVKTITDILHHAGVEPDERKEIEEEREFWRTYYAMYGDAEKEYIEKIEKIEKRMERKEKQMERKEKKMERKEKKMERKEKQMDKEMTKTKKELEKAIKEMEKAKKELEDLKSRPDIQIQEEMEKKKEEQTKKDPENKNK